jgi:hypothetical protein
LKARTADIWLSEFGWDMAHPDNCHCQIVI